MRSRVLGFLNILFYSIGSDSDRRSRTGAENFTESPTPPKNSARIPIAITLYRMKRKRPDATSDKSSSVAIDADEGGGDVLTSAGHAALLTMVKNLDSKGSSSSISGKKDVDGAAVASVSSSKKRVRIAESAPSAVGGGASTSSSSSSAGLDLASLVAASRGGMSSASELAELGSANTVSADGPASLRRLEGLLSASGGLAPIAAPPPAHVQRRADRSTAYAETSSFVSRWNNLVQVNRKAPHLSFSAEAHGKVGARATSAYTSTSALAAKFSPMTEFEAAIAEALESSNVEGGKGGKSAAMEASDGGGNEGRKGGRKRSAAAAADDGDDSDDSGGGGDGDGGDLLETAPVDEAQYIARQKKLAAMRALLFYDEMKARRTNKIKSKAYRRLKGRHDVKKGELERAELEAADPKAAAALAEAEAKLLAKERISLRHRAGKGIGGSKWIKKVLTRAGGNQGGERVGMEVKEALSAHLKLAEDLQKRMRDAKEREAAKDDEEEENEEGDDDDDEEEDESEEALAGLSRAQIIDRARRRILKEVGMSSKGEDAAASHTSIESLVAGGKVCFQPAETARLRQLDKETAAGAREGGGLMSMRFMKLAAERAAQGAKRDAVALANSLQEDPDDDEDGKEEEGEEGSDRERGDNAGEEEVEEDGEELDEIGLLKAKSRKESASKKSTAASARPPPPSTSASKDSGKARPRVMSDLLSTSSTSNDTKAQPPSTASSENPWLNDARFDSSAAGNQAASVSISRRTASLRAQKVASAATASQSNTLGSSSSAAAPASFSITQSFAAISHAGGGGGKGRQSDATATTASSRAGQEKRRVAAADGGGGTTAASSLPLSQAELIRKAFSNNTSSRGGGQQQGEHLHEDEELLQAEKVAAQMEEAEDASKGTKKKEKATPSVAMGWGAWAGLGVVQPSPSSRKPGGGGVGGARIQAPSKVASLAASSATTQAASASHRKDAAFSRLLISEKRDTKLARDFLVGSLPPQFKERTEYERTLAQPLGQDWNTTSVTASLTKPALTTRAGLIIEPIAFSKIPKGKGTTEEDRWAASLVASAGQHPKKHGRK